MLPPGPSSPAAAQERSLRFAIGADIGIVVFHSLIALTSGSLPMLAEALRGLLLTLLDMLSYTILRRIHRGRLAMLEFGTGKLEQLANLAIATALMASALWIVIRAAMLAFGEQEAATPVGAAFAALGGAVNVLVNLLAWDKVHRSTAQRPSVIMNAQTKVRFMRIVSSCLLQVTLTIAAVTLDAEVARWAEVAGSLLVAVIMVNIGLGMLRSGLPELMDRSLEEVAQLAILRALARHYDDYEEFRRLRTRRSGATLFVEVALGFDRALGGGEIRARADALRETLERELPGADVAIVIA